MCGESGRRKTAFANALAHALEYPRILYHDFTAPEPPPAPVVVDPAAAAADSNVPVEAPPRAFERMLVEACAYSEAARTVLVIDQLQAAEFADQIRLYHFLQTGTWETSHGEVRANAKHLLVVLISEQPLYHSLAKVSYRVWTDARGGRFEQQPSDHGLGSDARELFAALATLFDQLGAAPTPIIDVPPGRAAASPRALAAGSRSSAPSPAPRRRGAQDPPVRGPAAARRMPRAVRARAPASSTAG